MSELFLLWDPGNYVLGCVVDGRGTVVTRWRVQGHSCGFDPDDRHRCRCSAFYNSRPKYIAAHVMDQYRLLLQAIMTWAVVKSVAHVYLPYKLLDLLVPWEGQHVPFVII